jgi:3-hydroxybutyryl-CoA dehydratase
MRAAAHPVPSTAPCLEDFTVGQTYVTRGRTVTETHLVLFTGLTGIQTPFFVDHEYARAHTRFGSAIVPGFLTASVSGGLLETVLGANVVAGKAMDEFRFSAPVRPGDSLHAEVSIEDVAYDHADRGTLCVGVRVLNQHGEQVLRYRAQVVMKRRAPVPTHP